MYSAEHAAERERVLNAAYAEGKFPASRRQHYAQMFDANPERTTALLAQMGAGLPPSDAPPVPPPAAPQEPVTPPPAASAANPAADATYPKEWMPDLSRRTADPITHEMEGADAAAGADA